MVNGDAIPLRGQGKKQNIQILPPGFRSPSEAYGRVFKAVENISSRSFNTFVDSVDDPFDQPWRQQVKVRAQRLVYRAHQLSLQERNEPGWRMNIEPDVMERFREEIVWYVCERSYKENIFSDGCKLRASRQPFVPGSIVAI
jgi:hypothetical protein